MVRTACLAAVAALLLAAPQTASAYWPCGGNFAGYGYGYGYSALDASYFNGGIYAAPLPYYSVYPPVYYSHQITARHYGASPYAWYSGQEPITFVPHPAPPMGPMPVMVENPYVAKPMPAPAARADASEPTPQKIDNPFVASSSR